MTTPYELRPVIQRMEVEFSSLPIKEQIALAIVTVHQDCAFHMFTKFEHHPIIDNYYFSRWSSSQVRSSETRTYCALADKLMETVWFPTFKRIREELKL